MAKWGDISRAFNCAESNHTSNKPDTQTDEWDTMAEATRFALDQLIFKGDKLADRIEELEAEIADLKDKLAKAVGALDEAIYLLDPDEEDITKKTGLYRIVTAYEELTGGKDA